MFRVPSSSVCVCSVEHPLVFADGSYSALKHMCYLIHPSTGHGSPEQEHRHYYTLCLISTLRQGVGGQHPVPDALAQERRSGTHFTGSCVSPRASMKGCGKSSHIGNWFQHRPADYTIAAKLSYIYLYMCVCLCVCVWTLHSAAWKFRPTVHHQCHSHVFDTVCTLKTSMHIKRR